MIVNVTLVGNPNVGKTTLFNTMTKSNEKASNWHGVTVGTKTKAYQFRETKIRVTDIPGIYSLDAFSNEEKIAANYLNIHKDDLIINICDANNIKRNLSLTIELLNAGYKVVLIVNMNNEVCLCDYEKLETELGIKIFAIDARKNKDIAKINQYLNNYAKNNKVQNTFKININYTKLIKNNKIFINKEPYFNNDKIDKLILNKWLFLPLFAATIFLIFYLTFGPIGLCVTNNINIYLIKTANLLKNILKTANISPFVLNFINEAIVDSMFSILSFLPQVAMLMFYLNLLEDSGLMSRFAFMFDGLMKKIGLSGKSLFSLFVGFGCSTSAIITTRNLENQKSKEKTISLIPFIPCSAKLPIFLVIGSLFFDDKKYLFVFGLYLFSILMMLFFAYFNKKYHKQKDIFIIEMPKYRLPNIKKIISDVFYVIIEFLQKMTKIILIFSIIVWFLQNLSIRLIYLNGENFNQSLLYFISSKVSFLFKPIGLANAGIVVSIILGLCAKELIVVGLCMMNNVGSDLSLLADSLLDTSSVCFFTQTSAIVFLVFVLLYSPCVSALSATASETNKKFMFKSIILQMAIAYLVSFMVNLCLANFNFIYLIILLTILAIIMKFMVKLNHKNNICQGDCGVCQKNQC